MSTENDGWETHYLRDPGIVVDFDKMIDLSNPSPPIGMSYTKFQNWVVRYYKKYADYKFAAMFFNLYRCRHDNRRFYTKEND